MKPDTLVILSLPFQRLIRSHLSLMGLEGLTRQADVAVVSPFAETPEFVQRYKNSRIHHIMGPTEKGISWPAGKMVAVPETVNLHD